MADESVLPALLKLPAELILHILGFLEPRTLPIVALTCRTLRIHSYDDQLWQPLVNRNLPHSPATGKPLPSWRDVYIAHHLHWFLPRHRIWFADSEPSGKLLIARYDSRTGCIEAHQVVATRGPHTIAFWDKDPEVMIHSFNPRVSLDTKQPVLKLALDSPATADLRNKNPSDHGYSIYSQEILMEPFVEDGLYASFALCRALPDVAISGGTRVWPPLQFPAVARARNETQTAFNSVGHRPVALSEVSEHNFRLRKWAEYTGRRASPNLTSLTSPNGLSAVLGLNVPYFAAGVSSSGGRGMSIRMPEDITTYATLPENCYTPTAEKPWQGLWCGDYSGHGCEFLVIIQPDKKDQRRLPQGMDWLRPWFNGRRRDSTSSTSSYDSAQEHLNNADSPGGGDPALGQLNGGSSHTLSEQQTAAVGPTSSSHRSTPPELTDHSHAPTGRLEAIKLTGDPNIPRGEYTFIAPDIGHAGFLRIADEKIFRGARVVKSAGHIRRRGFLQDQYTRSQLIMISHDTLAQFWEGFGHISYYQRVDLGALMKCDVSRGASEG